MNALSKLKADYIESVINTNPSYANRLIKRRSEILLACLLTQTYAAFAGMMLNRSLSIQENLSYGEIEKVSHLFSSLFGLEVKTEDILVDRDDCANKALDDYDTMNNFLEILETTGYDRASTMAFCKQVENGACSLARFKTEAGAHYKIYTDTLFTYLVNACTYERLTEQFYEIRLFTRVKSPANIRRFIKEMRKALDLFYKIVETREIRASKRTQKEY